MVSRECPRLNAYENLQTYLIQVKKYLETHMAALLSIEADNNDQNQQIISNIAIISRELQSISTSENVFQIKRLYYLNFIGNIYEIHSQWESAAKCYRFTANYNSPLGLFNLGRFYYYGLGGFNKNITEAVNLVSQSGISNDFSSYIERKNTISKPSLMNRVTAGIIGGIGGLIIGGIGGMLTGIGGIVLAPPVPQTVSGELMVFTIGFCSAAGALTGLISGGAIGFCKGWEGLADCMSSQHYENNKNSMLAANEYSTLNAPRVTSTPPNLSTRIVISATANVSNHPQHKETKVMEQVSGAGREEKQDKTYHPGHRDAAAAKMEMSIDPTVGSRAAVVTSSPSYRP